MSTYFSYLTKLHVYIFLWLLLSSTSLVVAPVSMASNIPSLYVKGSYYEIGFQVGRTFQEYINQYYQEHPDLHSVWLPWSNTPQGQKVVEGFVTATNKYYPQYMRELLGMAHGANIPFHEMFLISYGVELYALTANKTKNEADSCSDILVNQPKKKAVIIGHNEDNSPLIQNKSYILTASVLEDGLILEQFTVYCYPGILPGNAFGFNNHGIITTVNGLYPKSVLIGRVGRSFINRAMLASKNLTDALSKAKTPGTYGFSCNIGIFNGAPDSRPHLYNIEVAPDVAAQVTITDVIEVLPSYEKQQSPAMDNVIAGNYFHVNMYRRLVLPEISDHITSSRHRTARIQQYKDPNSADDVKRILGDSKDNKYPIYRSPRPSDNETTLATVLFDLQQCVMSVYTDRPSSSIGPLFTLNLPCSR